MKQYEILSDEVVCWIAANVASRLYREYGLPPGCDWDDLLQEMNERAFFRRGTIDPSYAPQQQNAFISQSIYLESRDRLYCRQYIKGQATSNVENFELVVPDRTKRQDEVVDERLDAARVWQALDEIGLPSETRYFRNYFGEGLTTTQIAERYRITTSAVTEAVRRLKRKLRDYFTDPDKREAMKLHKRQQTKNQPA